MKNYFFALWLVVTAPAFAAVARVDHTLPAPAISLADIKDAQGVCSEAIPYGHGKRTRVALPSNEVLHLCEYIEFLAQATEVGTAAVSYAQWADLNPDFTASMPRALFLEHWDYRRVLSLGLRLSKIPIPSQ